MNSKESDNILSSKQLPVSESIIAPWIEEAIGTFNQVMPSLDIPSPPVYTATEDDYPEIRNKIVKEINSAHTEAAEASVMEYIYGDAGDAILIRRDLLAQLPYSENELHYPFLLMFWHELGHFYAINTEKDNLRCYGLPGLIDESFVYDAAIDGCGYSSARRKQEGYWFWQEFIAECISNRVSYTQRSVKNKSHYHPEQIDWNCEFWIQITEQLSDLLFDSLYNEFFPNTIDEYALAHYFAKLLTDDLTTEYIQAAEEGRLKIEGGVYPKEKIEPTCIVDYPNYFQPYLWEMYDILKVQLKQNEFWIINEDTLELLGSCIGEMMVEKLRELKRKYE